MMPGTNDAAAGGDSASSEASAEGDAGASQAGAETGGPCSPDLGYAMQFQSQTPDLLLATVADLPTGVQSRTIELWAYFDGTGNSWLNEHGLFETGDKFGSPAGGCHEFAVNSTSLNGQVAELHPYGNCDAVDNFFIVPSGVLTNNKGWLHVSFAYDFATNSLQFTINGDAMLMTGTPANRTHPEDNWHPTGWSTTSYTAADAMNTGLPNNPGGNLISIGSTIQFGGPAGWGGKIDEFRVWNVFRDAATIKANMYTLMRGNEAGLIAYYKFDEGSGMTVADSTGNHPNDAKMTPWNGSLTPPKWVKSDIPGTFTCAP
jgi:hypothetical protein